MSRPVIVAVVLLSLSLVGCAAPGGDPGKDDGPPQEPPEVPHRLELASCREQIGIFPVPHETVAPYLPEGYAPMPALPPDFYQDPDPTGESATLLLIGFVCERPQTQLFFPYIPVVPPEEQQLAGAYYHAVVLPCIADNATFQLLAGWSVPCSIGKTSITETLEAPTGGLWRLRSEDGSAQITLEGSAPASMTPAGPELIRGFHVHEQEVCAVVDGRVEAHEHWQFGAAALEVEGDTSFPVPDHPGLASLGRPGFSMNFTHMPDVPDIPERGICHQLPS